MKRERERRVRVGVRGCAMAGCVAQYEQLPEARAVEVLDQIVWVRLLRYEDILAGIGFHENDLVHFQSIGAELRLIRAVSLRDSVRILCACAAVEHHLQPDVESHSAGWERWLRLLVETL